MRRPPLLFLLLAAVSLAATLHLRAEMTEEEKRKAFLEAREEMRTVDEPASSPTPKKGKPKAAHPKSSAKPKPKASPKPTVAEDDEEEPTPTPKPFKKPTPAESAAPAPTATPLPKPTPSPTPAPTPSPVADNSPKVVIQKSGLDAETGVEPKPEQERGGFWPWQKPKVKYKYLTKSVRDAIDNAVVKKHRWRYIVVHNSGTRQGNAKIFDYYHRHTKKMINGLAYHFVVGNGSSSGNGEIEVGDRWRKQLQGGHVHSDYLNNIALGICLVGDFNRDQPTAAQLEATEELVRYLRKRVGEIDHKPAIVVPHRRINPPRWATDCPGDRFPYAWFKRF